MLSASVIILSALIPFLLGQFVRHQNKESSPVQKIKETDEKIDTIIASHDSDKSAVLLNDLLQRLHDNQSNIK